MKEVKIVLKRDSQIEMHGINVEATKGKNGTKIISIGSFKFLLYTNCNSDFSLNIYHMNTDTMAVNNVEGRMENKPLVTRIGLRSNHTRSNESNDSSNLMMLPQQRKDKNKSI